MNKNHSPFDAIKTIVNGKDGVMPMSEYINFCLHDEENGYYKNKNPFGLGGDFVTSSQITTLFGEMIGLYFAYQFNKFYKPNMNFYFIELGGGNGFFMRDLLNATRSIKGFHENITCYMVENSPTLKEKQKFNLAQFHDVYFEWFDDVKTIFEERISGDKEDTMVFVFCNEFFDCFAPSQYIKEAGVWNEIGVSYSPEGDKLVRGKIQNNSKPLIDRYLAIKNMEEEEIDDMSVIEFNLEALELNRYIVSEIAKYSSVFMNIDYGFIESHYKSTIQGMKNYETCDILREPCECDITYLLDFETYEMIAKDFPMRTIPTMTQGDFLKSIGIEEKVKLLKAKINDKEKEHILDLSVNRLIGKKDMGDLFKVLIVDNLVEG